MLDTMLVTGGAGFIGSNLVRLALAQTAARVVVVDKLTYAGSAANLAGLAQRDRFTFVPADIADGRAMAEILRAHAPRAVLNLAAETHVDRSIDDPRAFVTTNLLGTFELLEATRSYFGALSESERGRFRFLQVSTDEVYGALGPEGAFHERSPYAPSSPYAATKAGADHLARAYWVTFGLPISITCSSNNYGPYQHPEKLIPLMILSALAGEPLPVYGDGGNTRDWLFVDDHCAALAAVLERGRPGERYNVGGGGERTNLAVVEALCDVVEELAPARDNPALAGRAYRELITFVRDRPGHDRRYAVDAGKIGTELGWRPSVPFAEGLRRTVAFYLESPAWCDAVARGAHPRRRLGIGGEPRNP